MAGISIYVDDLTATWKANTYYVVNSFYKYNGQFYYALVDHNSGATFSSSFSGGVTLYNGRNKPEFIWNPTYNSDLSVRPNVKIVQFGDGYSSSAKDGINNVLLPFNLLFDKRDDNEARAILHFLDKRAGAESFVFTPPFPFNIDKLFVCRNWTFSTVFANNHTIRAEFIEVAA